MNSTLKEVLLVAGAGAFGGLIGVLASQVLKQPFPAGLLTVYAAAPVLGGGAGLIGVYLLANSDRKDIVRCMVFSMVCGIVWKPVFDAGSAIVTQRANVVAVKREADEVRNISGDLIELSQKGSTQEAKTKIADKLHEASELVASSVNSSRATDNAEAKDEAGRAFKDLLESGEILRTKNLLTPEAEAHLMKIETATRTARE
jgi:hypothetical protein